MCAFWCIFINLKTLLGIGGTLNSPFEKCNWRYSSFFSFDRSEKWLSLFISIILILINTYQISSQFWQVELQVENSIQNLARRQVWLRELSPSQLLSDNGKADPKTLWQLSHDTVTGRYDLFIYSDLIWYRMGSSAFQTLNNMAQVPTKPIANLINQSTSSPPPVFKTI